MVKQIIASIQARMASSRLPGKVTKPIIGVPMLALQVERLSKSRLVDEIVVATTTSARDDQIVSLCDDIGVAHFRGPEDDVLRRLSDLVVSLEVDIHVECFGDSPLVDPQILDEFVGYFLKHEGDLDLVTSTLRTTYPPGMEFMVYRGKTLVQVDSIVAAGDPLREHAGYNITRYPEIFSIANLDAPDHFRAPEIALEVDSPEDFALVSEVFSHFHHQRREHFGLAEILSFISANEALSEQNKNVFRRWKALRDE